MILTKKKMMKRFALLTMLTLGLTACNASDDKVDRNADENLVSDSSSNKTISPRANEAAFQQIERLGRPAVNEGLVISNDNLNAFNSIPPTLDLATSNSAVLAVLQEASASLDLFDIIDGNDDHADGFDSPVVKGFLPDVMRINTAANIPPGTAAYNGDFVINDQGAAMLTGGRKIEDDIVDITLSYLVAGDVSGATIQDNVSYEGEPGNISQGHKMLTGQTAYGGAASFPFLAAPY